MTLKGIAKYKGKLTCGLKNNIKNLVNFHASSQKSENLHCDVLLLSKVYKVLDRKVWVMSYNTEEWYKVWRKTDS